jgi:hypothetical protein
MRKHSTKPQFTLNVGPEREWFIAARSMRDTEPVSLLKLRKPDGSHL